MTSDADISYSDLNRELRIKAAELAVQIYYSEEGIPFLKIVDEIFQYLRYGTMPEYNK